MPRKRVLIVSLVLVLLLTGFVLGQVAGAASEGPGTQSDPLVTKSYLDREVIKLQAQIDVIKADIEKLKAK